MIEFPTSTHVRRPSRDAFVVAARDRVGRKVSKRAKLEGVWETSARSAVMGAVHAELVTLAAKERSGCAGSRSGGYRTDRLVMASIPGSAVVVMLHKTRGNFEIRRGAGPAPSVPYHIRIVRFDQGS